VSISRWQIPTRKPMMSIPFHATMKRFLRYLLAGPFLGVLGVILLWGVLFLPFSGFPALTLEEGTHAGQAQDIILRHHWFSPKLLGALPYFNKPPLLAWFMVASGWIFGGLGEFAIRLPALIATLAIALTVYALVSSVVSCSAALFAAALAMLTPIIMLVAAVGETDVLTTAFCFAAFAVFAGGDRFDLVSFWRWVAFGLLIGAAALTKGPIPLVFPVGGIAYFTLIQGSARDLLFLLLAAFLAFAMLAVWAVPNLTTDTWAIWMAQMRIDHALHPESIVDFLFSMVRFPADVFVESLPTSLLALPAMVAPYRRRFQLPERLSIALTCYSLVGIAILTLASAKSARYAMPAVPAFAVLAGLFFDAFVVKSDRLCRLIMIVVTGLSSFQVIRSEIVTPLRANVVQRNKRVGKILDDTISEAPAPIILMGGPHDMNCLFYMRKATQDLITSRPPPAGPVWVLFGNGGESWPPSWNRSSIKELKVDVESRDREPLRLYRVELPASG
jgi:4-amino-4-deoxy-L-arabinose transferase-like glycosyltransferase